MAILVEGVKTWRTDAELFNIRRLDAAVTSDGKIIVAYAGTGTFGFDGFLGVGQLNTTTDKLVGVTTRDFDGQPSSSVSVIDPVGLVAGPGGRMTALLSIANTAIGADANAALLLQRLSGSSMSGTAIHVDPAATDNQVRADDSSAVFDADGGLSVFYVDTVGGDGGGIRLARFKPDGTAEATPSTAVAERVLPGILTIETNPGFVDATRMAGGNYGLVWQENTPLAAPTFGTQRVVFQAVSASTGKAIGTALELDATSAQQPEIVTLAGGGMVVVWLDTSVGDRGIYKGQMLSPAGTKVGKVFEISSTHTDQETDLSLVALKNGGFAVGWRDNVDGSHLARLFDKSGKAMGNDFDMLSTSHDFTGGDSGLVAQGDKFYAFMGGINLKVGSGFVLQGQTWSTASSWGLNKTGSSKADTLTGGAKDDRFNGAKGNDVINGAAGNDALIGGDGKDKITGGAGRDLITGGAGADTLTGGTGADSFVFLSLADAGDTITDFKASENDRLVFKQSVFGEGFGATNGIAPTTQQGLFFDTVTKELTFDADGAGAAARILIARLTGVASLAFDDMVFI